MIPDQLRIQPGQGRLSPEQEREAERFVQARITAQLSTESVNEAETEALLKQAYQVAGLAPPTRICWVDGPLHLASALALQHVRSNAEASAEARVERRVRSSVKASVEPSLQQQVWNSVGRRVWASVHDGVQVSMEQRWHDGVLDSMYEQVWKHVRASMQASKGKSTQTRVRERVGKSVQAGTRAYGKAPMLAFYRFFDAYFAPNDLAHLASFNELVSGYCLGKKRVLIVRRPRLLVYDAAGRLHSATGKCVEYHDGWRFYAWHGVRVPERVILAPEQLTRDDFLGEPNVEVRRVIQERMGQRFVLELGGVVLDTSLRGTLYEVVLPNDLERVARYVQVQDASNERCYFLRVPPTIQTAAEAVAWTFQLAGEAYAPAQET
jgi:hypothetical protein